uniref:Uncharacterized protein n=1 Tax=Timema bartmani TaxID=61472 RepID=A0A7R9EQ62_9NEOP|nr:unnamed protein product [Timema bartmani]
MKILLGNNNSDSTEERGVPPADTFLQFAGYGRKLKPNAATLSRKFGPNATTLKTSTSEKYKKNE